MRNVLPLSRATVLPAHVRPSSVRICICARLANLLLSLQNRVSLLQVVLVASCLCAHDARALSSKETSVFDRELVSVLAVSDSPVLVAHPALTGTVSHVVGVSSNEQVRRINALAVVAVVAHKQADRHWSVVQLPRVAVNVYALGSANSERRVTIRHKAGRPFPALALSQLSDIAPKAALSFRERAWSRDRHDSEYNSSECEVAS